MSEEGIGQMRTSNKTAALQLIRELEGGYTVDAGGPTNLGITQTALDAFLRANKLPAMSVKGIGPAIFEMFYTATYWEPYHCDALPEPLDAIWLQCVVNLPPMHAVRLLQLAAYVKPVDGIFGPETLAQVLKMQSAGIEELLLQAQGGYYIGRENSLDQAGWLNRIAHCEEFLVAWSERAGGGGVIEDARVASSRP